MEGIGGVDWVRRWAELVERREEQWQRLALELPGRDFWTSRAEAFARLSRGVRPDDPVLERVRALLPAGDGRVLDVGAGAGRYAIPLAEGGARVVAVEPNTEMIRLLQSDAAARGVSLAVEQGEWPDAADRVGSADVVLCAHVVYPIADVVPFIRALGRAARSAVVLVARLGQIDDIGSRVFAAVHDEPRVPIPNLPDLYNLLLQIGIPASVTLHPFETRWSYPDAESAVRDAAGRLGLTPGTPEWERVDRAVRAQLVPHGDEVLLAPRQAYQGVVWWEAGSHVDATTLS
jgi:SAM-dependent methyltransferase